MAKEKDKSKPVVVDPSLVEAVAAKVVEMIEPRLKSVEGRQAAVDETLSKLSSEYAEVAKHHVTDWRDLVGEEYAEAEQVSIDASRKRRELMKNLAKYEQDEPDANKRGVDPQYAKLCAECNAAAGAVATAKRKATEIKDEAMAAIAS